jgi:LysR family glycine cleavage system transcriptional activator
VLPGAHAWLLREFQAAARHLSFTRAAQDLCVTQSAVSRAVRTLEEQLGVDLFVRTSRTLQLTQAGQQLFRATDEALRLVDTAAAGLAGSARTLTLTTTVALASTWLVPRLPVFARIHPELDLRVIASNDLLDLERESIDLALRFVPHGMTPPTQDKLFDYQQFPVCSPAYARDAPRPLREVGDPAGHVLLDFETTVYGRPWSDWQRCLDAKEVRQRASSGWLRFSHYDQVIEAALRGGGVAVAKLPHLTDHLRAGALVAPLGAPGVAALGGFYIEVAKDARSEAVDALIGWLREDAG